MILGSVNGHVEGSKAECVMRLDAMDPTAWALFPQFMQRSLNFADKLLNFNEMQIGNFEQDLRNRWASPNGSLFLAGLDANSKMVAHALGWINIDYGQPYLFIFQAEVDDKYDFSPIVSRVFEECNEYIGWANAMYERGKQNVRIDKVRMQTWRHADAFIRYLQGFGIKGIVERTVIGWGV